MSLGLVACGTGSVDDKEVSELSKTEEDQVENTQNTKEETEEPQEIKRTYPKREEPKKEVIEVENEDPEKDPDKEESEKNDKKDKEEGKKAKEDSQKGLTEGDYFFSYGQLVTVEDGQVVDALNDEEDFEITTQYIPYTNNMLVEANHETGRVSIKKINGRELETIFNFKENENFDPIGFVDGKVYGIHTYETENEEGYLVPDPYVGGLAEVDLNSGKVTDFVDPTIDKQNDIASAALLDNRIVFTRYGQGIGVDLFEFDLKKGYEGEPKKLENEDQSMFLLGAKHFSGDSKAEYDLVKATEEYIRVNDKKYRYAPQSGADAIGENVFILGKIGTLTGEEKFVFDMKIINFIEDKEVIETKAYGYRVHDGKLYYIGPDKTIESVEIGL